MRWQAGIAIGFEMSSKYYYVVFGAILGACFWIYFGISAGSVATDQMRRVVANPHVYDAKQDIAVIKLKTFYFVPKNKRPEPNWEQALERALKELANFHQSQFAGTSIIRYEVAATSTAGLYDNLTYDTQDTSHGNPAALLSIRDELLRRELVKSDPAQSDGYNAILIIYEGVGAAGTPGFALLSRKFLTDKQYEAIVSSLLAHEFYHTLGMRDDYDIEGGRPHGFDIMGMARTMPLPYAFIKPEVLKRMGI